MQSPDEILTLFESRMTELGITQAELGARAFGKADNSAIQGLKRGSSPAFDRVAAMADVLGLELYLGKPRSGTKGFADPNSSVGPKAPSSLSNDYLPIPWHKPTKGAGSSPVSFSYAWMTANGLIPDRLSAIVPDHVDLPDHLPGSTVVVIDARAQRRLSFGPWSYQEAGLIRVARLLFDRGNIVIMPGSPEREPRLLPEAEAATILPLGRVVWMGVVPKD